MNDDLWHAGQEVWQALTPDAQSLIRDASVLVATFVAAQAIGWLVRRKLHAGQFDAAFRRPWLPASTAAHSDAKSFTPTRLVTGLVRLTIWGGGLWCLARLYDWTDLFRGLEWIAGRTWLFAGVVLGALYLSRQFSVKLVEVVQASPLRQKLDGWLPPTGVREPRVNVAAILVGLLTDAVAILLVSLVATELMGWTLAGNALAATWQLVLHMSSAGVALLVGWGGARWVSAQVIADATPASSAMRVGHYAGIGVMGCATLLAILLLAGNSPMYFGLALLALFVLLLWPSRAWLPDIYAGAVLRMQGVKEVQIDGSAYRLGAVGLVQTQLLHPDETQLRRNRAILEAHLGDASGEDGLSGEAVSPNGKFKEAGKA